MATVNIDKIHGAKEANEAKQAQLSGSGSGLKIFKFKGSEAKLRIMPPWVEDDEDDPKLEPYKGQFWREVAQHWNINDDQKAPILCPKKTPYIDGDECPICDFVEELRSKYKNDPAALELAKDVRAKTAYLLTVIDRNDEKYTAKDVATWKKERPDKDVPFEAGDAKLQVYAAPFTVFNFIINIFAQGGDIVDLDEGRDVFITRTGKGIKTKYTVVSGFNNTPAGLEPGQELLDLTSMGYQASVGEMRKLLTDGIGGDYAKSLPSAAADSVASLPDSTDEEEDDADVDDLEAEMRNELG